MSFPLVNVGTTRFPKMIPRRVIRVTWNDGDTTETWINGSEAEILSYYVGREFNCGRGCDDLMKIGSKVEFIDVDVPASVAI